ncbi:MAG: hypothetical protein WCT20_05575 [Candidatus Babeliales bacterium]
MYKKLISFFSRHKIIIPLTVPANMKTTFEEHYYQATKGAGKLFLFAGDQKIEHLNSDFYGQGISPESADPAHLFTIASKGRIGAFATHLGLIARHGHRYHNINYIVKLNGKTNLIDETHDPMSGLLHSVNDVVDFAHATHLPIVGVGYTIYLGSQFEHHMLSQAAQIVHQAHKHGLLAVLWIYPRGQAVKNERDISLIAGATGVAASLGADFVKVQPPEAEDSSASAKLLTQACAAAGTTGVICSGGSIATEDSLLEAIHNQIFIGGARGVAIGRNIHQRDTIKAIALTKAIAAIVFDNASVKEATKHLVG